MATLSVRKLAPQTYKKLRVRAARHGVSMEEEVRKIIAAAVDAPDSISSVFLKYFGPKNGIGLDMRDNREPHDPIDFSG